MWKRSLAAFLALVGFLILAAALGAQNVELPTKTTGEGSRIEASGLRPTPSVMKGPGTPAPAHADRDLGLAARKYDFVYRRLSYGDRHLVEQLKTNQTRHDQLIRKLQVKQAEHKHLDNRVTDQMNRIRRLYPAVESREVLAELAHEYEATKKELDREIRLLEADLTFARNRIQAIEGQLRTVRARSISSGIPINRVGDSTAPEQSASIHERAVSDMEKLRHRIVVRRIEQLVDFRVLPLDPATCGRPEAFRTQLFRAVP